jgi:DmsE family decaheme c-type cytochrome
MRPNPESAAQRLGRLRGPSPGALSTRLLALLLTLLTLSPSHALAQALPKAAETCLLCHEGEATKALLHGPHAVLSDPRNRLAKQGCASCHGSSEAHMRRPARGGKRAPPDRVFKAAADPAQASEVCLDCHRAEAGLHWLGSAHADAGLACTDCHQVHATRDPMRDAQTEFAQCSQCHARERADFHKPSSHPLIEGQMRCSDCHAAHGSATPAALSAPTLNETCYSCHAETRGPFLWEHPPAREDCSNCHRPHGSPHQALLTQRTPFLCQQCHLAQFHPSTALSGTGLPGASLPSGSTSLMGRDCLNCHAQVHGSNHPSGAGATR